VITLDRLLLKPNHLLLLVFLLCSSIFSARASEKIKVVAVKGLAQQYNKIFLQKNVNVINITELGIKGTSLSLAHLVIMQQALYKGGLDIDFDFVISPNHKRSGALLSSGKAVISSFFSYAEAQPKDTYISSAVMAPRTLRKGIYGLASNKALMRVKSLDDLKPLKSVLVKAWEMICKHSRVMALHKLS